MRTNSLYRDNTSWGRWQIAGIARKLGYERLDNGYSGYEFGWGFNASSVINTFGRDQLKLQLAYGEGNGNYFNDGGLDIAPDSTDLNNADATAVQILGIVAYYEHYWSEKWSTSVGWSMIDLDTEDSQPLDEFKKGQIATANLLYYPASNVHTGFEFTWGEREDVDGEDGDDYRVQFSLHVSFSIDGILSR